MSKVIGKLTGTFSRYLLGCNKSIKILPLLLISMLVVAGCGGGGGSGNPIVTPTLDTTPDNFTFIDQTDVARGAVITSAPIVVSGINTATAISISGGEYAINGGAFTSATGTVNNADSVAVRLTSATTGLIETSATLTIGGVSDSFNVTIVDTAPEAVFHFPPPGALVTSDSITVTGTASDPEGDEITVLQVHNGDTLGGSNVATSDAFNTWRDQVALTSGVNNLRIETGDFGAQNSSAASITLNQNGLPFLNPTKFVLHPDGTRGYLLDDSLDALLEVTLSGVNAGQRRVISRRGDELNGGDVNADFITPEGIALNADASLAYVVDSSQKAVIEVTLSGANAGQRRVISRTGDGLNGGDLSADLLFPLGIALNADASLAYVVDNGPAAVIEVTLSGTNAGQRRLISRSGDGLNGGDVNAEFSNPQGIALNVNASLAYVVNRTQIAIIEVTLSGANAGQRRVISRTGDGLNGGDVNADFKYPKGIALNADASLAYVVDSSQDAVIEVILSGANTGQRRVISHNGDGLNGGDVNADFLFPQGIALNADASLAYVVDSNFDIGTVIEVTLSGANTGQRRVISRTGDGLNGGDLDADLSFPQDITLNADASLAYVVDNRAGGAVIEVTLSGTNAGQRRVISRSGDGLNGGDLNADFISPQSIALNADASLAYVVDSFLGAVIEVTLSGANSGQRRLISRTGDGLNGGDTNAEFSNPLGIAVNADASLAYVVDSNFNIGTVIEVTLSGANAGQRRVISRTGDGLNGGDSNAYIVIPQSIALNADASLAYVVDRPFFISERNAVIEITLSGINAGQRRVISIIGDGLNGGDSNADFLFPLGIALNADASLAYVVDISQKAVIEVTLSGVNAGQRRVVSNISKGAGEARFIFPISIALGTNGIAWVIDDFWNALFAIELTSGDRVIASQ